MNKMLIALSIAIVAGIVGYISSLYLGPDNPVEKECEKIINDEVGTKVDLSPESTVAPPVAQSASK